MVELGAGRALAQPQLGREVLRRRSPRDEALVQQRDVVAPPPLAIARRRLAGAVGDPRVLGDRVDAAVEDLEPVGTDADVDQLSEVLLGDRVEVGLVEDMRG